MVQVSDGDGGLEMEEFVALWSANVCSHSNAKELRELFVKIDANCSGYVSWQEFINYILVSYFLDVDVFTMLRVAGSSSVSSRLAAELSSRTL